MKPNRSIPPSTVIPVLVYPDVRQAVDWLASAFGFAERVRIGESHRAQMSVGQDGAVIVADVSGEQHSPEPGTVTHVIKVRVEDVDAQFERARSFGARVVEPLRSTNTENVSVPSKTLPVTAGSSPRPSTTSRRKNTGARRSTRGAILNKPDW